MKVVFCIPTIIKPYRQTVAALEASVPLLDAAGIEHAAVSEVGNPYISCARATMLRKAMDAKADVVVFIDHDVSWKPEDLLTLIQTEGDVCAGTYRFKKQDEEYMGTLYSGDDLRPIVRESDGALKAEWVPAGFLKVTKECVDKFMRACPNLVYGRAYHPHIDLFNHGAHNGLWYGEDYAFSRNWHDCGGDIWLVPDLDITHHGRHPQDDGSVIEKDYPGNFREFMLHQPGGSKYVEE
jgi:glycosyltransferase involved in cell wall biosynthesis